MADPDALSGWSPNAPQALPDPLQGWVPNAQPTSDTPPPQKGMWETAIKPADEFARDPTTSRIRGAFGEGYSSLPESVTRPGERSVFTPETQTSLRTGWAGGWPGAALNVVGDTLGTVLGGAAGVGNSIYTLGNEALKSSGLPDPLIRDINVEGSRRVGEPTNFSPWREDAPAVRELSTPPTPSPVDVWKANRAALPPDPVTTAMIEKLRQSTNTPPPPGVPPPPAPFTTTPGPTPVPSGGLLNMQPPPPLPRGGLLGPATDAPIMTQAEIQAQSKGFFSPADQAAAKNAMLPDTNATAVRKLFSDTIPSDPELAQIKANQPAQQAAKNVLPDGPMSYATAMELDRDLTSRMRGASGSDAHDLSQLQQSLRDQMDQVPDLDNLRPGRQAWLQSIKQGQMEDIKYGADLKNDPAAADAYVRQRAAALLKNDNAMRNWTPEETAALEQVAKSGDIGMLGRLSVSLIKPITRVALGAAGHAVAGPMGAIVGSEIGGDVGATLAARRRAYLSQTSLDPVMQQITRGVPQIPPVPQP